jgi:hypothetical protein
MRFGRWALVVAFAGLMVTTRPARAEEGSCSQQCGAEAEQAYQACIDDGGGEEDCKAAAAQTFKSCMDANCQEGQPGDCTAKCEDVATQVQNECLQKCDLVDGCDTKCQGAHDAALERCAKELCGEPDPGCGDDPQKCCVDQCQEVAHGVFAECIAANGEEAKDLCTDQAKTAFAECADGQCGVPPEVPCEDRCAAKTKGAFEHCLAEGKGEDVCHALADDLQKECVEEHCAEPGPTCEERCQHSAEGAFLECVANGGTEADCKAAAETNRDACVANECGEPDPDCAARCEEAVGKLVAACVDAGFDEAFCNAKGDEARRHCIDEHCDDVDGPEPTCEERCANHAQLGLRRCIAEGGAEADCKATAQSQFEGCVALHCSPDVSCTDRCDRKAQRVRRRCIEAGKAEADCDALAMQVHDRCVAKRCAPEPPDTCDSDCEARAKEVEQTCLDAGNSEADCAAAKQGVLDQCAAACGASPDATCTETCESGAQEKHLAVFERTNDEDRAVHRGQRSYWRCERHCE